MRITYTTGMISPKIAAQTLVEYLKKNGENARTTGGNTKKRTVVVNGQDIQVVMGDRGTEVSMPDSMSNSLINKIKTGIKQAAKELQGEYKGGDIDGDNGTSGRTHRNNSGTQEDWDEMNGPDGDGEEDIDNRGDASDSGKVELMIEVYANDTVAISYPGGMTERFPLELLTIMAPEYYSEDLPVTVTRDNLTITDKEIDRLTRALRELSNGNK